jgi:hypothetical protein
MSQPSDDPNYIAVVRQSKERRRFAMSLCHIDFRAAQGMLFSQSAGQAG